MRDRGECAEGQKGTQYDGTDTDAQPQNRQYFGQLFLADRTDRDRQENQADRSRQYVALHEFSPPTTPSSKAMVIRTMKYRVLNPRMLECPCSRGFIITGTSLTSSP